MTTRRRRAAQLHLVDGAAAEPAPIQAQPEHPPCPDWLSPSQQAEFGEICRRLAEQGLLADADVGVIRALAVAQDLLRQTTERLNAEGHYYTVARQPRPYVCPACKGSGKRATEGGRATRCSGCAGKGHIAPPAKEERRRHPEVADQRDAIKQIAAISARLGLDVASRAQLRGRPGSTKPGSRLDALKRRAKDASGR